MCEILVMIVERTHPDPKIDRQSIYKVGDPVVVMDDGHQWGAGEGPPKFQVIKFPGVPKEDMRYLIESGPPNLRDVFPRSMLRIKKLLPALRKKAWESGMSSVRRKRKIDPVTGAISTKPISV